MIDQKSQALPDKDQKQEINNTSSSSRLAASMADLMKSVSTSFVTLHKGDILKGKIKKLTSSEILIDINSKTDAVVLEKDKKNLRNILSTFKVGDEVSVSVLNPESDMGHPVVSLRRYLEDLMWEKLLNMQKNQEGLEATISEITKGGFLVSAKNGVSGFLPNSHTMFMSQSQDIVGKKINVFPLELNRVAHKIIFSQKPVLDLSAFNGLVKDLKIEQKIEAIIANVTPFGIFISIPISGNKSVDGLIHISEISWDKVSDIDEIFSAGQKVEAVIIGIDRDAKRVDLSIKRITVDPFDEIVKKFAVDQKVAAKVTQVVPTGVVLEIEENGGQKTEGFIRREKIPPNVSYEIGDKINATITQIDKRKHRIILVPVLLEKPMGYK